MHTFVIVHLDIICFIIYQNVLFFSKFKDDSESGFDLDNLIYCTLDLFVAGTETTSTTLYWGLLYMIKYPEIQGMCSIVYVTPPSPRTVLLFIVFVCVCSYVCVWLYLRMVSVCVCVRA